MKPNFALNITDDAASLLHRTARGWMEVGSVDFETSDLGGAIGYLRSSAVGLAPHGITTKLVLPPSQILYTLIEAPGPDDAARKAQIRMGLEGLTPYDVDDLVFDWSGTGPEVQVAVVARETLDEAESFATAHRLNPVSFVTIPGAGQFNGEPWFGPTALSAALLPEGENVERDQNPVSVTDSVSDATLKADEEALRKIEAAKAERELRAQQLAQAEAKRLVEEAEKAKLAHKDREKALAAQAEADRQRAIAAAAAAPIAQKAAADSKPEPDTPPQATEPKPAPDPAPTAETSPVKADAPATSPAPSQTVEPVAAAEPPLVAKSAPATKPKTKDQAKPGQPHPDKAPSNKPKSDVIKAEPKPPEAAKPPVPESDQTKPDATKAGPAPDPKPATEAPSQQAPRPVQGPEAPATAQTAEIKQLPAAIGPAAPVPPETPPKVDAPKVTTASDAPKTAPKPLNGTSPFAQGAKPQLPTATSGKKPAATTKVASVPSKAEALSRFKSKVSEDAANTQNTAAAGDNGMGEMGAKLAMRRGKPRFLGLILTLVLLAVLASVAAWSSVYLSRDTPQAEQTQIAEASEPQAPVEEATVEEPPVEDRIVETAPPSDDPPEPAPEITATSEVEAQTEGPVAGPQDEIMLAGTDLRPPAFDPVAKPLPRARPDGAPDPAMPPPPFGTEYTFDENGDIIATPNGVIMPEGFWLIAARPPVVPPARATPEPAAASDAATTASASGTEQPPADGTFRPDQDVESRKPRSRPAALDAVPAADPASPQDDASLPASDPSLAQIASLRPPERPEPVLTAAEIARNSAAGASLTASSAAPQDNLLRVAMSPRPAARPSDFSEAIAAAVSSAARETSQAALQRSADPEEQDEPEVKASAAPRIPTRASVAQQATFKNAINLSKTNLIGIYGSSKARYALIRTSSGRYQKVRVGDRLDGGTVAAITTTEVRYKKSGRMLSLAMPNG
ncbi:hypothetical protein [Pseudorhodobacter aquimaris]|uniref:hypothetical protein n=1 Tax=Pseudorhodobacter aquimaris TaxID=687412 RepID=UPI00067BEC6F|nr:hypothetical protein [Pseudorhodobacter aquimaris]